MKVILLGFPGVGKGVQGKLLANHFGVSHISIGDVVRRLAAGDTPLGCEIRESWTPSKTWRPLADELAIRVVSEEVKGLEGFVLDGFPRNVVQAKAMMFRPDVAITLSASEGVCRARVLARGRSGDSIDKFEKRLVAERERLPALEAFVRSETLVIDVDADDSKEHIFASILEHLGG